MNRPGMCEISRSSTLSAYLDGELPAAEQERMAAHIGGCSDCQRVVARLQAVTRWTRQSFSGIAAPPDFAARVLQQVADWHQAAQARRVFAVYVACGLLGFAGLVALVLSPFGMVLRALLHLLFVVVHGSLHGLSWHVNSWAVWVGAVSLLVGMLAITAAWRVLRRPHSGVVT